MLRRSLMGPPTLYDVHTYVVSPHFFADVLRTCPGNPISANVIPTAWVLIFAGVLDTSVMLDVDWRRNSTYSGHWEASQEDVL